MYLYMHVYLAPSYISFLFFQLTEYPEYIFFFRCFPSCQGDGGERGVGLWGRFAWPALPTPEKLHRAIQEKGHL